MLCLVWLCTTEHFFFLIKHFFLSLTKRFAFSAADDMIPVTKKRQMMGLSYVSGVLYPGTATEADLVLF